MFSKFFVVIGFINFPFKTLYFHPFDMAEEIHENSVCVALTNFPTK